jgi:hypothetical protein
MLLNPFRVDSRNFLYCQGLRRATHRRIKIAGLGVRGGESIERVLVSPFRDAASSHCVFNCLLAIAKCWKLPETMRGVSMLWPE